MGGWAKLSTEAAEFLPDNPIGPLVDPSQSGKHKKVHHFQRMRELPVRGARVKMCDEWQVVSGLIRCHEKSSRVGCSED
jgi:hypothetical protein